MSGVQTPIKLTGLYMLTDDGSLGAVDDNNVLALDEALSKAFQLHNRRFFEMYAADPDGGLRLAVLYRSAAAKAWGSDTLVLEESVVRDLYPIAGRGGDALTSFQQKNREKSIYRGMELLLDCRKESDPRAPIYCPILYDRGTVLGQYPTLLGRTPSVAESRLPVIEVLNLVGTIPIGRRDVAAVHTLMQTLRDRLIRKDMRHSSLSIAERIAPTPMPDSVGGGYQADRRAERDLSLPTGGGSWAGTIGNVAAVDSSPSHMKRWLTQPQGKADAKLLQSFTVLRDLSADVLNALASQLLIHAAPAGAQLLNRDTTDEWNMYLIEGSVALEPADGTRLFINGGSDKAATAIASLKPRKYTVTTVTSVRFLWIPDSLLSIARASAPVFKPAR